MAGNTQTENSLIRESASLMEALAITPPAVVSLVGGGGKTSLMFALAAEAMRAGYRVVTTTTTRIFLPSPHQSPCLILEQDGTKLTDRLTRELAIHGHVTIASALTEDGKLLGVPPAIVDWLNQMKVADLIINEADGANRLPIKAPSVTEPVIPDATDLVVAMVGMDALGAELSSRIAFRAELIGRLTGLAQGEKIDSRAIATLMTSPGGIIQHAPIGAAIVPFLNKMDRVKPADGLELVHRILDQNHPQIKRVVSGSLQATPPLFSIIKQI